MRQMRPIIPIHPMRYRMRRQGTSPMALTPNELNLSGLAEVALVLGGGNDPLQEYRDAKALCGDRRTMNFVCNDMIPVFPDVIDNAITLHPEKMLIWMNARSRANLPGVERTWCHRPFPGFSNHTRDWGGSSGLLCAKIARECGFTHVILCGVPMTVEGDHFTRKQRWGAAHAFRRGWDRGPRGSLEPFLRSMSGWTQERFGAPTQEWLAAIIPDPHPMRPENVGLKA